MKEFLNGNIFPVESCKGEKSLIGDFDDTKYTFSPKLPKKDATKKTRNEENVESTEKNVKNSEEIVENTEKNVENTEENVENTDENVENTERNVEN